MQFSKLVGSLLSASLITNVLAAPHEAKRDDDDDPVVVHIKTTVQNFETNYHTVQGEMKTKTNWIVDTSTATVTSYTATVTSTVFGTPHTFVTVATTPINTSQLAQAAQTETTQQQNQKPQTTEKTAANTQKAPATTSPKAPKPAKTTSTEVTEATGDSKDAPTITDSNNIPTSTDSWIIENITTVTSDSVCYVNYDYYYASEADETVTSTSTIYTTVTRT